MSIKASRMEVGKEEMDKKRARPTTSEKITRAKKSEKGLVKITEKAG